ILGNAIFANAGLGIELTNDPNVRGVTPNDPRDADDGANNLQNFPVLQSATSGGGTTTVMGTLNSTPGTAFRVEFFASPAADPSPEGTAVIPERGHADMKHTLKDRHGTTVPTPAADPVNPPDLLVSVSPESDDTILDPNGLISHGKRRRADAFGLSWHRVSTG